MEDGNKKYSSHRKGNREIITVSLPFDLVILLECYAAGRQLSRSEVVSTAVREYFKRENVQGGVIYVEG